MLDSQPHRPAAASQFGPCGNHSCQHTQRPLPMVFGRASAQQAMSLGVKMGKLCLSSRRRGGGRGHLSAPGSLQVLDQVTGVFINHCKHLTGWNMNLTSRSNTKSLKQQLHYCCLNLKWVGLSETLRIFKGTVTSPEIKPFEGNI